MKIDFRAAGTVGEVKAGVRGVRDVESALMQLARYLIGHSAERGVLVLPDVVIREERLRHEWDGFAKVARIDLHQRMRIVGERDGQLFGIPDMPDAKVVGAIRKHLAKPRRESERPDRVRQADFWYFTVVKLLMHRFVTTGEPMKIGDLATAAGCTYATVRRVLESLGSVIERGSDRSARLRWFPRPELARLSAVAPRVRKTARFTDRTSSTRSAEQHLKRLQRLAESDVAVGGIIGARHYASDLDIVGVSRLDLSLGTTWKRHKNAAADLARRIDPALLQTEDPLTPATLVIHQVPHAVDLFVAVGPTRYADPIDCLLDLYEARLDGAARDFLHAISKGEVR